jgi:hypothetical protein
MVNNSTNINYTNNHPSLNCPYNIFGILVFKSIYVILYWYLNNLNCFGLVVYQQYLNISDIRVSRSLVLCTFCRWLFVLLFFFFWPLCCLSFFDLRILITLPLCFLQTLLHEPKQLQIMSVSLFLFRTVANGLLFLSEI